MFNLSGFRLLPALLLVLSFLVLASAVQAQSVTSVRSLGAQKCSVFTEAVLVKKDRTATLLYSQWLGGFLTGKNASSSKMDVFPIRGPQEEWTRLIAMICASNQDNVLFQVAEGVLTKLKKYYIDPKDEVLEIKYNNDKQTIVVYRSFLQKSQSFLRSKRYTVRPDGNWGSRTEKAFSKFKKDNNIAGPPIPDAFFVMALISDK
jgi:hypothetical protein